MAVTDHRAAIGGGAGLGGGGGRGAVVVIGASVSSNPAASEEQNVLVVANRRCGVDLGCRARVAALRGNPQVFANVRAIVDAIAGGRFSQRELQELMVRVILEVDLFEAPHFAQVQVPRPGQTLTLNRTQGRIIDRILSAAGRDALGQRASQAYRRGVDNGRIRIR